MNHKITFNLEEKIQSKNAKEIRKIALDIEYSLLGKEIIPEEHLFLLLDIFSKHTIFNAKGAESFVMSVYSDFEKFSKNQRQSIFSVIKENFLKYENENFRNTVIDLLARKFPSEISLGFFIYLYGIGNTLSITSSKFGLDIFLMAKKGTPAEREEAHRILRLISPS